jgi:integrase/recombinase XerD
MVRRKLTLRVDADVIQKAKNAGMNLSYFLEVKLVEYLTRQSVLDGSMLPSGFEPESTAREGAKKKLEIYLSIRELEGITTKWFKELKKWLYSYLEVVNWRMEQKATLEYLMTLKNKYSVETYRKRTHQIKRFLRYCNVDWADEIHVVRKPRRIPKRVTKDDLCQVLNKFKDHRLEKQLRAIVLLGATTGMRPLELYQLRPENIDLERRIVYVNHNPAVGQTTKTGKSRIAIFNNETKDALGEFIEFYNNGTNLKRLFCRTHLGKYFRQTPLRVKDLRKFFSQEWDRQGGPTSIKKLLMGHRKDVDLKHYNAQNEEDLREIYDKVGLVVNGILAR